MPRLDETAKGVFVIAPTPFREDGALDETSAERMTDAFLEAGASGLTLLGVMGEAPKLDAEEARAVREARSALARATKSGSRSASTAVPAIALATWTMPLCAAGSIPWPVSCQEWPGVPMA